MGIGIISDDKAVGEVGPLSVEDVTTIYNKETQQTVEKPQFCVEKFVT